MKILRVLAAITTFVMSVSCSISADLPLTTVQQLQKRFRDNPDTTYVVNFWATWCKPCVAELPYFNQVAADTGFKKLKVILVSVDSPKDAAKVVQPFVQRKHITAETLVLNEKNPNVWIDQINTDWSGSIPATLIVQGTRQQFFETEFSYTTLVKTIVSFIKL